MIIVDKIYLKLVH